MISLFRHARVSSYGSAPPHEHVAVLPLVALVRVPDDAPAGIGRAHGEEQGARHGCHRRPEGVDDLTIRVGGILRSPEGDLVEDRGDDCVAAHRAERRGVHLAAVKAIHDDIGNNRAAIRTTYRAQFAAIEEMVDFVFAALREKAGAARRRPSHEWALILHLARATHVASGIVVLCETLSGDLAMMLVRSLFETVLSAYWLMQKPEERMQQFDRFAVLEEIDFAQLLEGLGVLTPDDLAPEHRDTVRQAELRREFKNPIRGWTKRKVSQLQGDVRKEWPKREVQDFDMYASVARDVGNRSTHMSPADTIARMTNRSSITMGPTKRSEL